MAKSYEDYQKEIAELQKKAAEVRRGELQSAISQIQSLMKTFNLTISDLKHKEGKVRKADKTAPVAKYKDPATGATWSGLGRRPAWAEKAYAENKLDSLLIIAPNNDKPTKVSRIKKPATQQPKPAQKTATPLKPPSQKRPKTATAAKKGPATKKQPIAKTEAIPLTVPAAGEVTNS